MQRREERLISGKGLYVDDIQMPNMVHCMFVGSAYAHALIKKLNIDVAEALPGVLKVLTGSNIKEHMDPLPAVPGPPGWLWRTPEVYPLVTDKIRFHGEPFAAVIAETPNIAAEAAGLIEVEYEVLPVITDLHKALEPDSPLLYEEWGGNVQIHKEVVFGNVQQAFKEADRSIYLTWRENRVSAFPIEARGCVTYFDTMTETLNVWSSTQSPARQQMYMAEALRMPTTKVKVTMADVGGGFGNKLNWWKETVIGLAAMLTGRPVKWVESKREYFITGPHQRDTYWEGVVAVKDDGTILGIDARLVVNLGVESTCREGAARTISPACSAIPNAYRWLKGIRVDAYGVVTNKSFYGAYRGFGKDKGIKFMERIIEHTARELKLDPVLVRERNLIQPDEFPFTQVTGYVYDSGNYTQLLERALEVGEVAAWKVKQQNARKKNRYIGIGVGMTVEPSGLGTSFNSMTSARVRITPDGLVEAEVGQPDIGQGSTRTRAIIVAKILGVAIEDVEVKRDSSDMVFSGVFSSRGAVYPTSALARATKLLRKRIIEFAAHFMNELTDHIDIANGVIYSKESEKSMTYKELAYKAYRNPGPIGLHPKAKADHEVLLDVTAGWFSPNTAQNPKSVYTTFCAGVDVVVVEVDQDTGEVSILKYVHVHDAGNLIDHDIVDGQIYGGIVQGIGEALYEELIYNDNGELLSSSYSDFIMPTSVESPNIIIEHFCTPSPYTELGTKGMGEAPIIGSKAAVINAVEDALAPFGIIISEAPATRERIIKWIRDSQMRRD